MSIDKTIVLLYGLLVIVVFSMVQVYNSVMDLHQALYHVVDSVQLNLNQSVKANSTRRVDKVHDPSMYALPNSDIYVSGAYLDSRHGAFFIRIPGLQYWSLTPSLMCVLQTRNGKIIQAEVTVHYVHRSWPPDAIYFAVLYSCEISRAHVPYIGEEVYIVDQYNFGALFRSLVTDHTVNDTETKAMVVPLNKPQSQAIMHDMVICMKATHGYLNSNMLLEWIELYRALGVSHFYIYDAGILGIKTPSILKYYESQNVVSLTKFPFLQKVQDLVSWMHPVGKAEEFAITQHSYLVSLSDCIYRTHDKVKYYLLVDFDELLLPYKEETLVEMAQRAFSQNYNFANVLSANAWYFADFNSVNSSLAREGSFFKLQRPVKRTTASEEQPKGILLSHAILSVSWHGISGVHSSINLEPFVYLNPLRYGIVHHFREICEEKFYHDQCERYKDHLVEDDFLFTFAGLGSRRVAKIKEQLEEQ